MFTRPVQKSLHELSTRLRIWADWIENKASQIGSYPAPDGHNESPSGGDAPLAAQPPAGWLADTQTHPPAHWLERIRRAPGGQAIEIHAVAQPLPRSQSSPPPTIRAAGPVAPLGSETAPAQPSDALAQKQPPAYTAPTPGTVLPVPAGVARPVLKLAVFPRPAAEARDDTRPQDILMPVSESAETARAAPVVTAGERVPLIRLSPAGRAPGLPQMQISRAAPDPSPTPAPPARNWPDFPVPYALPVLTNSAAGRAAQPENKPYPSPAPAASPTWPGLPAGFPPVQPPAPGLAQRDPLQRDPLQQTAAHRPDFLPNFPPVQSTAPEAAQQAPLQRDPLQRPSGRWPDLPISPPDEEVQDHFGDIQQQLERRQRIDQEQRGGPWNM